MRTPWLSMLHASYGRPEKAVAAMRMAFQRAALAKDIEYIFSLNDDDPTLPQFMAALDAVPEKERFKEIRVVVTPVRSSAPAWNEAAKVSKGDLLIQAQDDVEPPPGWDVALVGRLDGVFPLQWEGKAVFVAVSDGFRKDRLCCTAIMTRPYFEHEGFFLYPGYESVFSDGDVTFRAYLNSRKGRTALLEARDIVFFHRHHYHDKSVPDDATYQKENRPEAYSKGQRLFNERNPEAIGSDIVDW